MFHKKIRLLGKPDCIVRLCTRKNYTRQIRLHMHMTIIIDIISQEIPSTRFRYVCRIAILRETFRESFRGFRACEGKYMKKNQ